ncbi:helix-turn-helix domain-containing protein [Exiguobacterium aurantiacum]|uniref:XRE family transcriptional regulator n=1 Tax=Exiguobacterium aurantiacum TaxID=33987 RepID=A0ABY5FLR5_9BACL|nr:XRE family transcriptional regulator [Exiguobacterium aurantiacum]UTT42299.1 XRE family transcriptional regulator [Exiguobacterium aurantiacum]
MDVGQKIKRLRVKKGLTQEELAERTDLSKGYISQIERDLSSPSLETLFDLLEVLGCSPKEFFDEEMFQKVSYTADDRTVYADEERKYRTEWLIPESNEKEMEPILLRFSKHGEFKRYEPSRSETFVYVLSGRVALKLGHHTYFAKAGETLYYVASDSHQLVNDYDGESECLIVATHSYL